MKRFLGIYLMLLVLLMASACEDFLDLAPVSQITTNNFWQTPDDFEAGAIAMYDGMQSAYMPALQWGEVRATNFSRTEGNIIVPLQEYLNNELSVTSNWTDWNQLYVIIGRANLLLQQAESSEVLSEDQKNQYRGEAYFARALSYFYAVRNWGDVPLVLKPYESAEDDFEVPRSPKREVLTQIESDLERAVDLLPTTYPVTEFERGRATQGAAQAALTDAYLWIAQLENGGDEYYNKAIATADAIIGSSMYQLLDTEDYIQIFHGRNSDESIFELQFSSVANELQRGEGPAQLTLGSVYIGFGGGRLTVSEDFMQNIETGDQRMDTVILEPQATPRFQKWVGTPTGTNQEVFLDANFIIYRLADIMLLKAEALNNTGRTDEAITLVNTIRNRAGLPNTTATASEQVKDAILSERRYELCAEGKYYYDLRRNGVALERIDNISSEENLLLPINQSVLNQNRNVSQNEFYQ